MHTCRICLDQVDQLRRHITIKHKDITFDQYLSIPEDRILYEEIEAQQKKKRSKNSPYSMEYYKARGISEEEGQAAISSLIRNKKKHIHPAKKECYLQKGFSEQEAEEMALQYRSKLGKLPTLEEYREKYGDEEGQKRWDVYYKKIKGREDKFLSRFDSYIDGYITRFLQKGSRPDGYATVGFSYEDFQSYSNFCRRLTKFVVKVYRDRLDPEGIYIGSTGEGKNGYAIDHRFSIYGGFYHSVDPYKICSIQNLEIITKKQNSSKSQFCTITLEETQSFPTILEDLNISENVRDLIKDVFNQNN